MAAMQSTGGFAPAVQSLFALPGPAYHHDDLSVEPHFDYRSVDGTSPKGSAQASGDRSGSLDVMSLTDNTDMPLRPSCPMIDWLPDEVLMEIIEWALPLKCAKTLALVHPRLAVLVRPLLLARLEIASIISFNALLAVLREEREQDARLGEDAPSAGTEPSGSIDSLPELSTSPASLLSHSSPMTPPSYSVAHPFLTIEPQAIKAPAEPALRGVVPQSSSSTSTARKLSMPKVRVRSLKLYPVRIPWAAAHELVNLLIARQEELEPSPDELPAQLDASEHGASCAYRRPAGPKRCRSDKRRLELDELSVRFQGSDLHHALDFYELVSPKKFEWMTSPCWMIRPSTLFERFLLKWTSLRSLKLGGFLYDLPFARSLSLIPDLIELELQGTANVNLDPDVIVTLLDESAPIGRRLRRLSFGGCPARRRHFLVSELEQRRSQVLLAHLVEPPPTMAGDNAGAAPALDVRSGYSISWARQHEVLRWKELEMTREPLDLLGDLDAAANKMSVWIH